MKIVMMGTKPVKDRRVEKWVGKEWKCRECGTIVIFEESDDVEFMHSSTLAKCPTCNLFKWFNPRYKRWRWL